MRISRTLAAVALAVMLTSGRAGPSHALASPAHDLPPGGYIFAGLQDGHVYRSADGGATWQAADAGLSAHGDYIWSLAVAPDGTTVYAATARSGLWASADDGASWRPANGSGEGAIPPGALVRGVAVDPLDGRHLFAAAFDETVYTSKDGGQRWSAQILPPAYPYTMARNVYAMVLDPRRPRTLLVGTYRGLLVSTDGGAAWNDATGGPSYEEVYSLAFDPRHPDLAFDPRHPDLAYATAGDGLYRSADGGRSWRRQALPFLSPKAVAVDPSGLAGVLAASWASAAIARSRGGLAWRAAVLPDVGGQVITAFGFDPARPAHVLAGLQFGDLLVSTDSGSTWHQTPGPGDDVSPETCLATTPHTPRPSEPVDPPSDLAQTRYFPAAAHTLRDPFLTFWDQHGNLPLLGLPLTEPFREDGQAVQYFERARLVDSGGRVGLSPLGLTATAGRHFHAVTPPGAGSARLSFPSTGHSLGAPFLAYWRVHQGSTLIGPPIGEPLSGQNGDGTGRRYLVQYFRNMRLEYHPELRGTPDVVQPGQLGRQVLHQRGWI